MKQTFNILLLICFSAISFAQADDNEIFCFECHGDDTLTKIDSLTGKEISLFVNPEQYTKSVHKNLFCTDCHSTEFETIPHPENLEAEEMNCLDCHIDDEIFKFEMIQTQLEQSIHFQKMGEDFNCSVCHNQHTFYISARNAGDIKKTIEYGNSLCVNCHQDEIPNEFHNFLPHQKRHLQSVRCIDCHAKAEQKMVSHFIGAKETALRTCEECHSVNSILLQTLYQFKIEKERNEKGFVNALILNNSYVVGATRNYYFNILSLMIFGLTIFFILIHLILRLKLQDRNLDDKK